MIDVSFAMRRNRVNSRQLTVRLSLAVLCLALGKCHDCSNTICSECREGHAREATNQISALVSHLRRALPKLSDTIGSHEQRVNRVKVNHAQIERDITSAIAALMEELTHRKTALFTEAEVYMQSQLR